MTDYYLLLLKEDKNSIFQDIILEARLDNQFKDYFNYIFENSKAQKIELDTNLLNDGSYSKVVYQEMISKYLFLKNKQNLGEYILMTFGRKESLELCCSVAGRILDKFAE